MQKLDAAEQTMAAVLRAIGEEPDKAFACCVLSEMWGSVASDLAEANRLTRALIERGDPSDLVNVAKSDRAIKLAAAYRMDSE